MLGNQEGSAAPLALVCSSSGCAHVSGGYRAYSLQTSEKSSGVTRALAVPRECVNLVSKEAGDPLERELQMAVNHYVGAGT